MERPLMRGVAPQKRDQAAYPTLGGGAEGRSLGSIFLVAICDQHATPACPHSLGAALLLIGCSAGAALVKCTVMGILRCAGSRRMSQGNPRLFSKRDAPSLSAIASA